MGYYGTDERDFLNDVMNDDHEKNRQMMLIVVGVVGVGLVLDLERIN